MAKKPEDRAARLFREAKKRHHLHDRQLQYLGDTLRHAMLCREIVYILAAQDTLDEDVVAALLARAILDPIEAIEGRF